MKVHFIIDVFHGVIVVTASGRDRCFSCSPDAYFFFPRFPFARTTDFKMHRMKHRLVLLFESFDLLCLFSFIVSFSLHFTCSLKLTFLNAEREFSRVIHVIPALSCPMERQRGKYFLSPQSHSVSIVDAKLYVNNCTRWWK